MNLNYSIIFDVGNVLLDWNPEKLIREQRADPVLSQRLLNEVFLHADWDRLDAGELEAATAADRFADRIGISPAEGRQWLMAANVSLTPKAETVAWLEELANKGVPLYCLSNMSQQTHAFLQRRFSFWRRFRGMVISGHVGAIKPNPAIYQRLLRTYRLDPRRSFFFDDRAENVAAAQAEGIASHEFRSVSLAKLWLADRLEELHNAALLA